MNTTTLGAATAPQTSWTPAERHLTIGGLLAIGVSFGFARYGYGLFLPDIRREFDLSVGGVGIIASTTYVGYLVALLIVGAYAHRLGPRLLVGIGGVSAALGMALVALAPNLPLLTTGLVLAGTSPAWAWAPYSDAVDLVVHATRRERVLAIVPAGTAVGTAVVGPLALVARDGAWRYAWLVMAAGAVMVAAYNAWAVPGRGSGERASDGDVHRRPGIGWLFTRSALPLYLTALSYGVIGSFYWSYATEMITRSTTTAAAVPAFWTLMGAAGIIGVLAGTLLTRLGLGTTSVLLFGMLGAAVALLGTLPGSMLAAAASATLYGPAFMAVSSLLAVWSYQVFPLRPTTGFTATLLCLGGGTVLGPAILGILAGHLGLRTAFLATAGVALVTMAVHPVGSREHESNC